MEKKTKAARVKAGREMRWGAAQAGGADGAIVQRVMHASGSHGSPFPRMSGMGMLQKR